ncbi:ABC transporter ATP-binding protein (plasmid) [Tateyamaria omphalii]|uniref:ABC transporter ATP-binding protein n=1 Tax=Tateyamaria omphalii TaxID=299262 RepID=A0A1P8N1S3_9RHOB|nr:ABC transporter ATP-binding protein [Tateyamaria omphalii]
MLDLQLRALAYHGAPVLRDVSVQLAHGETLALVGPSGIGKSSLLRVIAGLHTHFDGTYHLRGTCAMVFQEPTLLPWRSVSKNISLTTGASDEDVEDALRDVGLAGRGADFPGQLSLGQQRRLALARAFAVKPDLLLLDEPFVSLDPDLIEEMMTLFTRLRAAHGVATILVTHVEDEAKRLAHRIVTLGGQPATIVSDVQNDGAYFQLSASGVTSSRS